MPSITRLPEPLRKEGATAFERRVLDAAARERPSDELQARMAAALGVSLPLSPDLNEPGSAGPAGAEGARASLSKAGAAGISQTWLPWLGGITFMAAVAGGLLLSQEPGQPSPRLKQTQGLSRQEPTARPVNPQLENLEAQQTPAGAELSVQAKRDQTEAIGAESKITQSFARRRKSAAAIADLEQQIALIDQARDALLSGASDRALRLVRQYESSYPSGSFSPEASVLKLEVLAKQGRNAEARALATRFIASHPGSPLSERAARVLKTLP